MRFSRIVSALACAFVLNANAAPVEDYTQYLPDGANLALVVQKIGASAPTIDYHSQQMALPASTQKVLTALAALLQLGPDYRFTTTLFGSATRIDLGATYNHATGGSQGRRDAGPTSATSSTSSKGMAAAAASRSPAR